MSLAAMMNRTATLVGVSRTGAVDNHNMPMEVDTSTTVDCYLEQLNRSEVTLSREAEEATHLAIFPAGTVLDGTDRVVIDGTEFEVVGPPWNAHRGGGDTHHVEATLKELTG